MPRTDRYLMQAVAVHRQEFVVDRVAAWCRYSRAERSADSPLTMIEPSAAIGCVRRPMAIKVTYGPFEPDRRRMESADGGKASLCNSERNHAGIGRGLPQCDVDRTGVAPKPEEIRLAVAKRLGDCGPDLSIDVEASPQRGKPDRRKPREDRGDCAGVHRRHPSIMATLRNHCTTGPGNHTPAMSTNVKCT